MPGPRNMQDLYQVQFGGQSEIATSFQCLSLKNENGTSPTTTACNKLSALLQKVKCTTESVQPK